MRVLEILLPPGADRSLSPQKRQTIDALQKRMNCYTDKILDPKTSQQGKEFLKARLRDDYYELKDHLEKIQPEFHVVAEEETEPQRLWVIYDNVTKSIVSKPYTNRIRASRKADKLDLAYGAYRYFVKELDDFKPKQISEAVHKLPLSHKDFDLVKELMERPIPAVVAPIYIQEVIDDDEFNDQLVSLAETDPGRDIRSMIVDWIDRVMPDQMYRFKNNLPTRNQQRGIYSPIHGYDSQSFKGTNDPITGDAYGYR